MIVCLMQEAYLIKASTHAHLCGLFLNAFDEGGNNVLVILDTIAVAPLAKALLFHKSNAVA